MNESLNNEYSKAVLTGVEAGGGGVAEVVIQGCCCCSWGGGIDTCNDVAGGSVGFDMTVDDGAGESCGVVLLWDKGWDNTEDVSVSLAANVWLAATRGAGADVTTTLAALLDVIIAEV